MQKADRFRTGATVACAIYTRKSSDEGLAQEFNSLDAQREACEAYIVSQKHAGWIALPDMYDDGGLSGGTMERPALQRLLAEIKAGKVQIVVVYKVDRLTRSLADFAKIVDVFDAHGASFVSVTQSFNTTTSMGRLTLNMLLSFAQFEREIAGERIRDKIAASKAKGMWMGGNVPLGYDVNERKLVVNETEADTVRFIFRRYAEMGSVKLLQSELDRLGIVSKRREGVSGQLSGGQTFSRGALYLMLQNRNYRGEIVHKGTAYPGQHDGIIDPEVWQSVRDKLATNRHERSMAVGAEAPSLLAGLMVDAQGHRMTPTHAVKKGKRYRYYVSTALITGSRSDHSTGLRIPAGDIEGLVLDRLRTFFASETEIGDALAPLDLAASMQRTVLGRSAQLAESWVKLPTLELRGLVRSVIERVTVGDAQIVLRLSRHEIPKSVMTDVPAAPSEGKSDIEPVVLTIEASLRRAGKGTRLVIGHGAANAIDEGLVTLIRQAVTTRAMFLSGRDDSIDAMAQRRGVRRDYLTVFVRLSYLAPGIVRAILDGRQPTELTPTRLVKLCKDLPHDWQEQRQFLGFSPA